MVSDNKQPDPAFADKADNDTVPLTSKTGQPISERSTDTGPLTPETGQPIRECDTGTTTRLIEAHVLERRCGSDGPT